MTHNLKDLETRLWRELFRDEIENEQCRRHRSGYFQKMGTFILLSVFIVSLPTSVYDDPDSVEDRFPQNAWNSLSDTFSKQILDFKPLLRAFIACTVG